MPELPEIEVARKTLTPCVAGKTISEVLIERTQAIRNPLRDDRAFAVTLNRHRVESIERWGKALVFRLDGEMAVIFHFKLGANVSCRKQRVAETAGVAWNFSDGTSLEFFDLALSEFHLAHNSELDHLPVLKQGTDPLARSFNHELLKDILSPRKQIKTALTDQDVISGIGNTYADEILWNARINPFRKVGELKENDFRELAGQIKSTLAESIKRGGEVGFRNARGRHGRYQTKVHGREGQPCPRDGVKIKAVKRGRKTFWCPKCQK
mgnify:CR=1 FL=1